MLPDLLDGVARNLGEDAVGFHLPNYFDSRNASNFFLQQPRHAVGAFGASPPKVMGQQRFELRGDKAHFRRELHALLAQVQKIVAELSVEEYDRLASNDAIFGSPERKNVDAQIARRLAEVLAERNRGVRDAGAVHVQEHVPFVRELGSPSNFFRTVNRTHLSGLRVRDDPDLDMMLIANTVIG